MTVKNDEWIIKENGYYATSGEGNNNLKAEHGNETNIIDSIGIIMACSAIKCI